MEVNINPVSGVPGESYNYVDRWMANPLILFIVLVVILMYYTLFSYAGGRERAASGNGGSTFLEVLLWGTFLTIVLMNALRYFYGANIVAKISKLFSQEPQVDITVTTTDDAAGAPVPELTHSKQVFHVPGNHYTFDNAKAVCAAYGGKLASYNQMEDAYEDGADWCSYGWSEDQMAFFPTQEEKWKKLQKIEGHKHDCGRPGINGGYIANPNVKFGVNCYGYKPDITPYESQLMRESTGLPTTKKDQEFQKLVKEWKKKIPQILISPFNKNEWSSF